MSISAIAPAESTLEVLLFRINSSVAIDIDSKAEVISENTKLLNPLAWDNGCTIGAEGQKTAELFLGIVLSSFNP